MAATYNAIDAAALFTFLEGLGFVRTTIATKDGHEVVYERQHHGDPNLLVVVYTSCSPGGESARKRGKDAIRVCLVCESDQVRAVQKHYNYRRNDGRLGLAKAKRVHRAGTTEAIFGRIHERATAMYRLANQMHRARLKGSHCTCGSPIYPDTGKCVLRSYCRNRPRLAGVA